MSAVPIPMNEIGAEASAFRARFQTLHLGTADTGGVPTASYAPFAPMDDNGFGIYVSELSAHTPNLLMGRPVRVLFIESEEDAQHLFARKRLTFTCDVVHVPRGSDGFDEVVDALRERFGDFMNYLKTMQDFHAFRLVPTHGTYVRGFAQAYELPGADFAAVRHINDQGHREEGAGS